MTLYDDLLAAGVPLASHGSDLYAKVTEDSRALVEGYEFRDNVTKFRNAEDGAPWYLIPDVGKKSAPDSPCCYIAAHGILGLHALDCPQHRPETCPTCQEETR